MQRRVIAAIAAVLLAGIGAVLMFTYVSNADARAMAGQEPTDVLVVAKDVPAGTLGKDLAPYVELKQLPRTAIAANALRDTAEIQDLATTTELKQGEQVLASRFAAPDSDGGTSGQIAVPNNMQQISLMIDSQRAVAGRIVPGDKIAINVTKDNQTAQLFRDVLVLRVDGGSTTDGAAATSAVMLTLALTPDNVKLLTSSLETAQLWIVLDSKTKSGDAEAPISVNLGK
jgi:pilus assembly protein CpaB